MQDKNLVYDVGAHDGTDTAYYLKQGYKVVAIEANPLLSGQLKARFADETAAGRLIVLQVAVTEKDHEKVTLYISKDNSKSSLIKEISERDGTGNDPVAVAGRSLGSLFNEFGVPWYCKIDIEGYDAKVIAALTGYQGRPPYISCEGSCKRIGEVCLDNDLLYHALDALVSAGYSRFKLIDQDSLLVLSDESHYGFLNKWSTRVRTKIERWTGRFTPRYNHKRFKLKNGSLEGYDASGPFGESLPGEWNDYDTTKRYLAYHFRDYFNHTQNKQLIFWVDIHAKY